MLAKERQDSIVEMLNRQRMVNTKDLAKQFGTTVVSIRRDIDLLVEKGIAKKFYGGAMLNEDVPSQKQERNSYSGRQAKNRDKKKAIAASAVMMIHDGDTIYLDVGTTAAEIAGAIAESKLRNLTIVTNSIAVVNRLSDTDHTVFVPGGFFKTRESFLSGESATNMIRSFYFDLAFLGTGGLSFEGGLTEFSFEAAQLRQIVIQHSKSKVVVSDSSKFGSNTFTVVCPITSIDVIITDEGITERYANGIRDLGVSLIISRTRSSGETK